MIDDKKMRGRVLDDLMKDMDEYDFEKKLKPKLLTITIEGGGEVSEDPEHEASEGEGMEEMEDETGLEDEGLDPRLMKLIRSKLG